MVECSPEARRSRCALTLFTAVQSGPCISLSFEGVQLLVLSCGELYQGTDPHQNLPYPFLPSVLKKNPTNQPTLLKAEEELALLPSDVVNLQNSGWLVV